MDWEAVFGLDPRMQGLGFTFIIIALLLGGLEAKRASNGAHEALDPILWVVAFILLITGLICAASGSGRSEPENILATEDPSRNQITRPRPPTKPVSFYIYMGDEVKGPFSFAQVEALLQVDSINSTTPCCAEGSQDWKTIADLI